MSMRTSLTNSVLLDFYLFMNNLAVFILLKSYSGEVHYLHTFTPDGMYRNKCK
jgi:hypothetical protein